MEGGPGGEADADRRLGSTAPAAAQPPEPLPSLDDITADGDLSAFLRSGVPTALKNAAMRKMWSLDPAIRDHVGLAEYAWDFNQPGTMAGFGPLEAGKSVADFLSKGSAAPAESEEPFPQATLPPSDQPTAAAPDPASAFRPEESAEPSAMPEASRQPKTEVAIAPGSAEDQAGSSPAPRPRHGGAVPR